MDLQVSIDTSGLASWSGKAMKRANAAAMRAGSDALKAMRAEASRRIRDRKNLKVSQMDKALTTKFAEGGGPLVWTLKAANKQMPVIAFGARPTRKGVSVEINKGKRSILRGAFIAKMRSGHEGVFYRVGKKRLPIDEAYTTGVMGAFVEASQDVAARGVSVFQSAFARNMRR